MVFTYWAFWAPLILCVKWRKKLDRQSKGRTDKTILGVGLILFLFFICSFSGLNICAVCKWFSLLRGKRNRRGCCLRANCNSIQPFLPSIASNPPPHCWINWRYIAIDCNIQLHLKYVGHIADGNLFDRIKRLIRKCCQAERQIEVWRSKILRLKSPKSFQLPNSNKLHFSD